MNPEDVRHSDKSRETRRASAGRLMYQTRIIAPPNNLCCGAEIPYQVFASLPLIFTLSL
jgi:hypothetical protein